MSPRFSNSGNPGAARAVLADYRAALRRLPALVTIHLAVWLVWAAVLGPAFAVGLELVVRRSGQSAVTDQDIARLLLSPAGALGGLVLAAVWLVATVLTVAAMTLALNAAPRTPLADAAGAFAALVPRLPALLRFAIGFTLRVLALALPFMILALAIAWCDDARP